MSALKIHTYPVGDYVEIFVQLEQKIWIGRSDLHQLADMWAKQSPRMSALILDAEQILSGVSKPTDVAVTVRNAKIYLAISGFEACVATIMPKCDYVKQRRIELAKSLDALEEYMQTRRIEAQDELDRLADIERY